MVKTLSVWKELLDRAPNLDAAEAVMGIALDRAPREELLEFLGDLYAEFAGPDPLGGESGTLDRIRRIVDFLSPTDEEFNGVDIDPAILGSYLKHCETHP